MTLATLGCEFRALDIMHNSGLWFTWTTLGPELSALDAKKHLRFLYDKKGSRSWAQDSRFNELLRVVDSMNDFKSSA